VSRSHAQIKDNEVNHIVYDVYDNRTSQLPSVLKYIALLTLYSHFDQQYYLIK
jgi:hypothetical protein